MRLGLAALCCLWSASAQAAQAERFAVKCASTNPQVQRSLRIYSIQNGTVGEWYGGDVLFNLCRSRECRFRVSRQRISLESINSFGGLQGVGAVRREVRFVLDRKTGQLELVEAASAQGQKGKRVDLTRSRYRFLCRQVPLPDMAMN